MNNAEEQYTLQAHSETKETFSEDNAEMEPQGKVIQLNLGSHARNSGGHYVEVSVPDSVKTFLTVTPTAQLDKMALDNERMFEARYGFRAGQAVRKQVIAMQQQYDLTDSEVATLRKAGQLSIRPNDQSVCMGDDVVGPVAGGIYLFSFTVFCLFWLIDVQLRTGQDGKKALASLLIGLLWIAVIWFASTRMIGPWHMIRQRIRQAGKGKNRFSGREDTDN